MTVFLEHTKFPYVGPRKIDKFCGWAKAEIGTKQYERSEPDKRPPRPSGHPSNGGELGLRQERSKFSSCGGVPEGGGGLFIFYIRRAQKIG